MSDEKNPKLEAPQPPRVDLDVVEEKTYRNRSGMLVKEFTPVFERPRKAKPVYRGVANVKIRQPMGGGHMSEQQVTFEFSFPDGTTLKQAFKKFDETFKAAWADHEKRQQKLATEKKIIPASHIPKILGADGRPHQG